MDRRSLLASLGTAATVGTAGCISLNVAVPDRTPIGDLPDSIEDVAWRDDGHSERSFVFEGTAVETEQRHPIVGDATGVIGATGFGRNGLYPDPGDKVRVQGSLILSDSSKTGHYVLDHQRSAYGWEVRNGSVPEGSPFSVPDVLFMSSFPDDGGTSLSINENSEPLIAGNVTIRHRSDERTPWHKSTEETWAERAGVPADEPIPEDSKVVFEEGVGFNLYWQHPTYPSMFLIVIV